MKIKLLVLALAMAIIACSEEQQQEIIQPIPVKTQTVSAAWISIPIYRSGLLAASSEARLSFKTGGIIDRIFFDEGDRVNSGQVLAALNLSEIQAQVTLAQSGYEKAQRDLRRIQKLYRDSVATLEQMQDLETAADVAEAKLRIAQFNLKHSRITAPSKGRILKRFAEENELISPGAPVFYFGSFKENWIIRIGVTDRDIVTLQLGDSANVAFDAHPGTTFPAKITQISESADQMSGTFEIELTLDDKDNKLVSGFVAKATIFPSNKVKSVMVPLNAVVDADNYIGFVYSINDTSKQPVRNPVTLGPIINNRVMILDGLKPGMQIITDGSAYLTDQSHIKIVN